MLRLFTADDLNLHDRLARLFGNSPPFIARQRPWIHAVDDNSLANAEIVGGHCMGNGVLLGLHDQTGLPERLLD